MSQIIRLVLYIIAIIIVAPLLGGLLTGIDRVITARMQGRKGPSVLQPFYLLIFIPKFTKTVIILYIYFIQ